ncbi:MAG: hypothetical protein L0Y44_10510 [Phycisphaerales bacterium]|nr:hypothetical protein [Phycisphaerales bacterium]MCI0631069.1 hypothetical protein [Phycisphaerales bacterium]MCI0676618.1 hypothetical protein [Phycisphaerales bacterium]
MAAEVPIDGVRCKVEKLPGAAGAIRVSHPGPQCNALTGPGTEGEHSYLVYPCQRHQYEFWNAQLAPEERGPAQEQTAEQRPWWSFGAGERASLRE